MVMFIDREEELEKLMELSRSKKAELALIYGRRRVGKSRLLVEFAKKTGALYMLADVSENILDILSKQVPDEFVRFGNWEDFFEFLYKSKHKIIIIDEFQYLYQVNKAWPTILQRWWEKIKETDKKIILCGSIISTIYKISKGYGSALYGRKTLEMHIAPIEFEFIKGFSPDYTFEQLVEAYSILGGIPRYLEEFDSKISIDENIKRKVLDKTSFLYNEPINLLFEEFRTPAPYISILLAITQGYMKFGEIADVSKIQGHKLPKYLAVLERVQIIEKEIPVTENKIRAKTTSYKIRDNFYRFWFKFLFQKKSMIEQGMKKEVFDSIKKELNSYTGRCFEDICRQFLLKLRPISFSKIGRWWHKDIEIDLVCLDENKKEALFVECKWSDLKEKDARKILEELKEKSKFVEWKSSLSFKKKGYSTQRNYSTSENGDRKEYFGLIGKK
ncbi:MAG: ATP-binding protein, partial [Candidatus Aenigmarchaeota archaeon]|nr:ATP-binding protein [Candidatus Aenigmarchaeota archaeon]